MDDVTTSLGEVLRHFRDHTCPKFNTKELPRETKAHQRKKAANAAAANAQVTPTGALKKSYNMETYKGHSAGDIADHIRRLGTTESYSSQVVHYFPFIRGYQNFADKIFRVNYSITHQRVDIHGQITNSLNSNLRIMNAASRVCDTCSISIILVTHTNQTTSIYRPTTPRSETL